MALPSYWPTFFKYDFINKRLSNICIKLYYKKSKNRTNVKLNSDEKMVNTAIISILEHCTFN